MNINMQDYWYSPAYVIYMEAELVRIFGQNIIDKDGHNFQKVGEMKCAAIMLLALHKAFGHHFYMQASKDAFPDVWSLYQEEVTGENVQTKYQTVEVVIYDPHSDGDVGEFILNNKLINPKKAYDEETMILCYIRKKGTFIDFKHVFEELKKHTFKPTRVFIIGNMASNENMFTLSQIWPMIKHEAVDYAERAKVYPLPYRMFFKKGIPKKINTAFSVSSLKPNPYEVFYIDENKVKLQYKK